MTAARILAWTPAWILLAIAGAAALAPVLAPYDPAAISLGDTFAAPSLSHWLGTDQLGRDLLSRVLWGGRVSLAVALAAVILAGAIGGLAGVLAGYRGGVVDAAIMRVADIQFALPAVILALVLAAAIGPGFVNLVVILSLANWARFARVLRSETLSLRTREFVVLARLAGASGARVMLTHIVPNVLGTFVVLATLDVGLVIILEATLSFLGLGVQPPTPSWGTIIADGRAYLDRAWWIAAMPGALLMLTVLCGNLAGDRLRDRLNPALDGRW